MTNKLFLSGLAMLVLLLAFPRLIMAAELLTDIAFFRAIQDKSLYAKNPARYEHLVLNDRTGSHEHYIEKQPAHIIPKTAIESVTVREAKPLTATGEPLPETKARRLPKYYELTFKIKSPDGKRFSVFTDKNKQAVFETKIGTQTIGLQQFDLPFEPDESGTLEFKIYFREVNGRLKEMLAPFQQLVIWK
jgi:hypothetical protein